MLTATPDLCFRVRHGRVLPGWLGLGHHPLRRAPPPLWLLRPLLLLQSTLLASKHGRHGENSSLDLIKCIIHYKF